MTQSAVATVPTQLVSYIAPAAPATRRPAEGNEPFLRVEIGFTPAWFRQRLGLDFGERFHHDVSYRCDAVRRMRAELRRCFAGTALVESASVDGPLDLLTGTDGACTVAAIYGVPVNYAADNWPCTGTSPLSDGELARLEPPDLARNEHVARLMDQLDAIEEREGRIEGYLNWQGVLNNAHRLWGEQLFIDLLEEPERCRHLFACVCETMIQGIRLLHERQTRANGGQAGAPRFVTVSNCLVNLIAPSVYRELLLPFDRKLAEVYDCIGVHNCAWNATPYLDDYASVPHVAYIDMGIGSDLRRARELFPQARRAVMYTPMDAMNKPWPALEADLAHIARDYGPCDVVIADIDPQMPDDRVRQVLDFTSRVSPSTAR